MTEAASVGGILPTAAEEARFWALIETAWTSLGPEPLALRRALIERDPNDDELADRYAIDDCLDPFLDALRGLSEALSSEDLVALDRVLERRLHGIDRADIHEVTDGSDDGFLYCRGYIVALGRAFYDAVTTNPTMAILDAECEAMCYFFAHLHRERFGTWTDTGSGISRETGDNVAGWPR
ncbi:DUF4240 domain-containing protein [Pseudofrankia asymbiotica]|uniref:DUF4240 domain-containing protein n=1 Tax=Pseudofrankia asymbiotica TaxID=1834516 RepID=A0A1V2HZ40_9ACTN|nr:DUF4240 domain-containing protein [Pseudofrankia asymbiotica]ONH21903.1 hypothetical protein BL253_37395 [Pseudofrankia asymbiotica]